MNSVVKTSVESGITHSCGRKIEYITFFTVSVYISAAILYFLDNSYI